MNSTSLTEPLSGSKSILTSPSWLPYALAFLLGYPLLIRALRYQRVNSLPKKYNYPTRESMAKMTDEEAFQIQKAVAQLEFPFIFIKSLQFALFRTYGIPTISALLTKTTQFSNPATSLKRYTDTSTLVQEMVGNSPTSSRAMTSFARTRYLHARYRASGQILEPDMLYTLALFALEPIRFIERFEWRPLSDLERCAIGQGFRDGIQWLEEIERWSQEYEREFMVPDVKNRNTADQTTAILVYMLPRWLCPVGLQFVSLMMDERLRRAMMYDPPTAFFSALFASLLTVRKLFLRYLVPPRPYFLRYASFTEEPDQNNRFFLTNWEAAPYYVKPTLWNRWGPMAWLTWALGRPVPGDEGDKYYPSGYDIADVGPKHFEGKGKKELEEMMEHLKDFRTGKCPFH
ncbi:hypothetical protein N7523_004810 [Penicillium sp. IBT 18751x]|nr:hypothetical protein N7523_004810 [Penicillium sp. IBT 18751x]